jgi:hypothetical protein
MKYQPDELIHLGLLRLNDEPELRMIFEHYTYHTDKLEVQLHAHAS